MQKIQKLLGLTFLNSFQKILFGFLVIRSLAGLVYCFISVDFPHAIRQTDTLSISIRYWSRWVYESPDPHPLIPALLNSGTNQGYMPSEFPIQTLLAAPFFYFGSYYGKVLSCLFIWFVVTFLIIKNIKIWKHINICGINGANLMLLIPLTSVTAQLNWRFMPDFTAFQLCLLAIGITWDKNTYIKPFILTLIGILLKPITILTFAIYLLHQKLLKKIYNLLWLLPSILLAYLYYDKGIKYIDTFRELPSYFAVQNRMGLHQLYQFFLDYKQLIEFLNYFYIFPYGLPLFLILFTILVFLKKQQQLNYTKILLVTLIQILFMSYISGSHVYIHSYYWYSISPLFCLIWLVLWHDLEKFKNIKWTYLSKALIFSLFLGYYLQVIYFDFRGLKNSRLDNQLTPFFECKALIERNPSFPWKQGYVFLSNNSEAPYLGVCFAERTNYPNKNHTNIEKKYNNFNNKELAHSYQYGFFYKTDKIPSTCHVIDNSKNIQLVTCNHL